MVRMWASDKSKSLKENHTRGRLSCYAPRSDPLPICRDGGGVGKGWEKRPLGSYPVFGFRRERGFRSGGGVYSRLVAGASGARGQQISSLSLRTKIARSA